MFSKLKDYWNPSEPHQYDFSRAKRVCRIFIIDDDPQALPVQELQSAGYNVQQVETVDADVMRMCEEASYDVILLDYTGVAPKNITPDDGFGVFERIRSANPAQYIIAISAMTYDIAKTEYFKNANDWLKKPTDLVTTKQLIDKAIHHCFDRAIIFREIETILRDSGVAGKQIGKTIENLKRTRGADLESIQDRVKSTSHLPNLPEKLAGLLGKFVRAIVVE